MIKSLLCAIALVPMVLVAQNAAKVVHSEIVEVKGATAQTLTSRATTFLQLKKIEAKTVGNVLSGVGTLTVSYPSIKKGTESGFVKFNLKMMIKDGKYKVDLTDFKHEGMHGKSSGGPIELEKPECGEAQISGVGWAAIKEQTQVQLKAFVQEMKIKMDHPVKTPPPSTDF